MRTHRRKGGGGGRRGGDEPGAGPAAFTEAVQSDGPRVVGVDGTVGPDGMTKVASADVTEGAGVGNL